MNPQAAKTAYEAGLASLKLLSTGFIIFLSVWIVLAIYRMREMKMREYARKKREAEYKLGDRLHLTSVLPDLNRDELRKFALKEKEQHEGEVEKIDLEEYDGLLLKPKVYFDADKDKGSPDDPLPEPKIKRSFLSNEPIPAAKSPDQKDDT